MKNKIAGLIIAGITIVFGIMVYSFNAALKKVTTATCTMGTDCSMYSALQYQTNISLIFIVFLLGISVYLIFFGQEKVEIIKKIREKVKITEKKKDYSKILPKLPAEEKKLVNLILESQGAMFQSELVEKSGFDKVKVSRLLDRLEGQQIIERRRRGMTNIVILK